MHHPGAEVGSAFIDGGFQKLAEEKLEGISHLLHADVKVAAFQMRNNVQFQKAKVEFGKVQPNQTECFTIEIPDLQSSLTDLDLHVEQGRMIFRL